MLRILIGVFLVVVIVEGAIRKWILPEYSNEVFAVKDVILLLAFISYVGQRPVRMPKASDLAIWLFWALAVVVYAGIGGFSLVSLIGLRYYLAPLPLLLIIPELIRNPEDLDRAAVWAVRLAIPIGILGVIQYFSPPDSRLNSYAWSTEEIGSTFGVEGGLTPDRPRVTGTFSYISTYASFLSVVWVLGWLSALHSARKFDRRLAGFTLILVGFNMAMNGSRALLLVAAISGLPFAIALIRQLGTFRTQFIFAAFLATVVYVGESIFEPFALTADRGDAEEAATRVWGAVLTPYYTLSEIDLVGQGIGTTFGGFEQLGYRVSLAFDEINLDRVGIELGVVGYVFVLGLKLMMLVKTFAVYTRERSARLRHWALAALLIQLSTSWQIPIYNSIAAVFYFSAFGLVYWIQKEQGKMATNRDPHRTTQQGVPLIARQ